MTQARRVGQGHKLRAALISLRCSWTPSASRRRSGALEPCTVTVQTLQLARGFCEMHAARAPRMEASAHRTSDAAQPRACNHVPRQAAVFVVLDAARVPSIRRSNALANGAREAHRRAAAVADVTRLLGGETRGATATRGACAARRTALLRSAAAQPRHRQRARGLMRRATTRCCNAVSLGGGAVVITRRTCHQWTLLVSSCARVSARASAYGCAVAQHSCVRPTTCPPTPRAWRADQHPGSLCCGTWRC
jgi:hypothetical protein